MHCHSYPEKVHTVRKGESLYSLALLYGVSVNKLLRNNPQFSGSNPILYPGERVIIKLQDDIIGNFETGGYTYTDTPMQLIDSSMPYMNFLMPFTYGFDASGNITYLNDEAFINAAK